LLARLQSILRRADRNVIAHKNEIIIGDLVVNYDRQSAYLNHVDLKLTTAEFAILNVFVHKHGKVLSRDQILDTIRGIEWDAYSRSVDVLISRLRQKLEDDPKNPHYIKTVWGSGYMFIGDRDA
jgi:two-component system phosphate regulon response regulator OmpR